MKEIIFSDLDRTIIPNGPQPESDMARPLLRRLARESQFKLVYVSGRSRQLIKDAIEQYNLPQPDYAVADVGTSIYQVIGADWQAMPAWHHEIAASWQGREAAGLADILADLDFLTPQEAAQQGSFKLSYYIAVNDDHARLSRIVSGRLAAMNIRAAVITSIDESENKAFLDVLPENATKLHAVRFLLGQLNMPLKSAVFCGDSGNDLPVLTSEIQAVLVANATEAVRNVAVGESHRQGHAAELYLAGGRGVLNGNYSAGVLEGAAHFLPGVREWLEKVSVHQGTMLTSTALP